MPKFGKEEIRNLTKVIESGCFCDKRGGFMDQFRADFARELHAKHAVAGGAAMLLMHAIPGAIGAGAGDEIICDPVVQFHGIACLHNNVVPVWADVRPDNFLMDPASAEKRITKRTKAIWVTHLWGFPAEVDKLKKIADKHGIILLEDCAHALTASYKGKLVGNWGAIGTFSFNMGKQLPTGEGGMAITNDDRLFAELNRRIIFGESPEVLSSNYRMTELQAAVGVAQLKKVPGYLKEYRQVRGILDEAVADCSWLDQRKPVPGSVVAPYIWSALFRGERKGITQPVFHAALRQAGAHIWFGFTQRPAYMYDFFRNPNAYGNKGCPYNCHLYTGKVDWKEGLCPVAEEVIPRIISTSNMVGLAKGRAEARALGEAIRLAESGNVKPLEYAPLEKEVLAIVKARGPLDPMEVIAIIEKKKKGWHTDEHYMFGIMEGLRDRFPYKLSHAGPRKFAYHDLT
ncbi:MAG: DegT/DnrJ/EryC1/StrS family aminotransferase [Lentisphaerae bacterium]|nr:DegT/DnrJ/EryC1/StrS family aminotransferase [Lentisphaerota bacterium]